MNVGNFKLMGALGRKHELRLLNNAVTAAEEKVAVAKKLQYDAEVETARCRQDMAQIQANQSMLERLLNSMTTKQQNLKEQNEGLQNKIKDQDKKLADLRKREYLLATEAEKCKDVLSRVKTMAQLQRSLAFDLTKTIGQVRSHIYAINPSVALPLGEVPSPDKPLQPIDIRPTNTGKNTDGKDTEVAGNVSEPNDIMTSENSENVENAISAETDIAKEGVDVPSNDEAVTDVNQAPTDANIPTESESNEATIDAAPEESVTKTEAMESIKLSWEVIQENTLPSKERLRHKLIRKTQELLNFMHFQGHKYLQPFKLIQFVSDDPNLMPKGNTTATPGKTVGRELISRFTLIENYQKDVKQVQTVHNEVINDIKNVEALVLHLRALKWKCDDELAAIKEEHAKEVAALNAKIDEIRLNSTIKLMQKKNRPSMRVDSKVQTKVQTIQSGIVNMHKKLKKRDSVASHRQNEGVSQILKGKKHSTVQIEGVSGSHRKSSAWDLIRRSKMSNEEKEQEYMEDLLGTETEVKKAEQELLAAEEERKLAFAKAASLRKNRVDAECSAKDARRSILIAETDRGRLESQLEKAQLVWEVSIATKMVAKTPEERLEAEKAEKAAADHVSQIKQQIEDANNEIKLAASALQQAEDEMNAAYHMEKEAEETAENAKKSIDDALLKHSELEKQKRDAEKVLLKQQKRMGESMLFTRSSYDSTGTFVSNSSFDATSVTSGYNPEEDYLSDDSNDDQRSHDSEFKALEEALETAAKKIEELQTDLSNGIKREKEMETKIIDQHNLLLESNKEKENLQETIDNLNQQIRQLLEDKTLLRQGIEDSYRGFTQQVDKIKSDLYREEAERVALRASRLRTASTQIACAVCEIRAVLPHPKPLANYEEILRQHLADHESLAGDSNFDSVQAHSVLQEALDGGMVLLAKPRNINNVAIASDNTKSFPTSKKHQRVGRENGNGVPNSVLQHQQQQQQQQQRPFSSSSAVGLSRTSLTQEKDGMPYSQQNHHHQQQQQQQGAMRHSASATHRAKSPPQPLSSNVQSNNPSYAQGSSFNTESARMNRIVNALSTNYVQADNTMKHTRPHTANVHSRPNYTESSTPEAASLSKAAALRPSSSQHTRELTDGSIRLINPNTHRPHSSSNINPSPARSQSQGEEQTNSNAAINSKASSKLEILKSFPTRGFGGNKVLTRRTVTNTAAFLQDRTHAQAAGLPHGGVSLEASKTSIALSNNDNEYAAFKPSGGNSLRLSARHINNTIHHQQGEGEETRGLESGLRLGAAKNNLSASDERRHQQMFNDEDEGEEVMEVYGSNESTNYHIEVQERDRGDRGERLKYNRLNDAKLVGGNFGSTLENL